jgi:hypothetical protein
MTIIREEEGDIRRVPAVKTMGQNRSGLDIRSRLSGANYFACFA